MNTTTQWKRLTCVLLSVLVSLWCSESLYAREKYLKFDHVIDLGVDTMQAFYQDQDGFLWIGTSTNGLFRYDGATLKNYGTESGLLAHGNITRIIGDVDNPDLLWIATLGGGFFRFDKATDTFKNYTARDYNETQDNTKLAYPVVYALIQDEQDSNVLWLVGDRLFQKFEKDTETFSPNILETERSNVLEDKQFFNILQDQRNPDVLWIAAWGLVKYEKSTEQFTTFLYDPDNPASLGFESNFIGSMAQDKDDPDTIWMGYWDGAILDRFDTTTETFTHYTHDPENPQSLRDGSVQLISDDGSGTLWLGGWGDANGLTAFEKETQTFTTYYHIPQDAHSLSSDTIVNVFKDRSGILWIVSANGKIDKYDPYNQNIALYQHNPSNPNSLLNNSVNSIYEDAEGVIWFATESGLSQFDPTTQIFRNYPHHTDASEYLEGENVLCAYQDSSGDFWVGLYARPLLKIEKQTGRILEQIELPEGSSVASILEDPDDPNILWLGVIYNVGFAKYNKATHEMTYYPPNQKDRDKGVTSIEITEILHDREDDAIWLGSKNGYGLTRLDKATETFTHYFSSDTPDTLSHDNIGSLYQDDAGVLWIGTLGGGLNAFHKDTQTFTRYGSQHGVPSVVNAIVEEQNGLLWLSTNKGIMRFKTQTGSLQFRYIKSDGLQGDAFSVGCRLKTQDGTIWFGGTNGVNSFHPDKLITNPYVPPIVLTDLTQGGEPFDWEQKTIPSRLNSITLNWRNNFFEFEYIALNYTISPKNRYKYMLQGLDKDWYDAGTKTTGRYVSIPPGRYTLRIIGSNNDGVWNNEGVSLAITIVPPFWKATWFFVLFGLTLSVIVVGLFYFRTKQLQHFNAILRQKLDERTAQLNDANEALVKLEKEQLERQMAGGFAHEMRNALVGVIIGLDVVIDDDGTMCQKNSELLGQMYDMIAPHIPEDSSGNVLDLLRTIDQNEETLDTILKETKTCTTHALDVTKLILEYSRLGRTEVGNDDVSIQNTLQRIVQEHAARFAEQGIVLDLHGTAPGTLLAHAPHIHSIMNNIVLNARDALLDVHDTRKRSIQITLREEQHRQMITIEDTADGISEDNLTKIFDPFFSTKPTTGTGLGLNFVARLVKLYHGTIDVSSQEGQGTRFTLEFPVRSPE